MNVPEDSAPFHIELDLRERLAKPRKAETPAPSTCDGAEAQEVLAEARRFAQDPEQVIRLYQEDPETWGGAYISGDELLRMLPCRPRQPWLSYALGGQVLATFPMGLFSSRMTLPAHPGDRVLVTMGMPASGKTTLVKAGFGKRFFAVVDSPLGNFDLARELVHEIQASGRGVSFVLASRPLAVAAAGMLDRAMPGHEERAVPLTEMAENILKGMNVFRQLAEMNRYDGDTTLVWSGTTVIEGPGSAVMKQCPSSPPCAWSSSCCLEESLASSRQHGSRPLKRAGLKVSAFRK